MIPKVSVIIPTYNCAEYISDAIASVLNQTYKDIEITVIDDGSSDNTRELLDAYIKKSRIKYFYQKNRGPGAARNTGIRNSAGEYVCFLDADDIYDVKSVENRLYVFQKYPELGLVFTDFKKVYLKNHGQEVYRENDLVESGFLDRIASNCLKIRDGDIFLFNEKIFFELILFGFIWTGTVMIRRDALDKVGFFNEAFRICEDYDLWLRISGNFNIALRMVNTATYRFHSNNVTKNLPIYCDCSIEVRKKYLKSNFALPNDYKKRLKIAFAALSFRKGYYYFGGSEHKKAKVNLWRGIRMRPTCFRYYIYFLSSFLPLTLVRILRTYKHTVFSKNQCISI